MIPQKYASLLFGMILSGMMSFLVSGISVFRATGWAPNFGSMWVSAWLGAWLFAFPAVILITPLARKAVQRLIMK